MRKAATLILAVIVAVGVFAATSATAGAGDGHGHGHGHKGGGHHKVTICHNGHTITIDKHALDGHFDHDGQPAKGHEGDHMGKCEPTTVPTTPTTVPEVTTTIPEETTTTGLPNLIPPKVISQEQEQEAPAAAPIVAQPSVTG